MSNEVFDFLYPTDELVNAVGRLEANWIVRVLMTCLVEGHFVLSSGAESNFKFVLDDFIWRFGRDDFFRIFWSFATLTLGALKSEMVCGVPIGGERIANELIHDTSEEEKYVILFDDVLTSGSSIRNYLNEQKLEYYKGGVVLLDRLPDRNKWFKEKYTIFSMVNIKY